MTIEEKAKAYDEAIEKIKYVMEHGVQPVLTKEDLRSVFPEIFESEDERIRKAIITFFESEDDNTTYALVPKKDILAWLERQGNIDLEFFENGENEKREFVGYGFLKCKGDFLSFKEGETYWLEYVGKDNYNVRSDNLLGQTFHITPQQLYTVFRPTTWLEKQGDKPQGKTALEAVKEISPAESLGISQEKYEDEVARRKHITILCILNCPKVK